MTKQFKVYFSIDDKPDEITSHDATVVIEALHDKEAVLKFSKISPTAIVTNVIEFSETYED